MDIIRDKKKIIIIASLIAVLVFLIKLFYGRSAATAPVFDKNSGIHLSDIAKLYQNVDFNDSSVLKYFGSQPANPYTMRFFKSLQMKFQEDRTIEEHFETVRKYLLSVLPEGKAEEVFALYKKFVKYEIDVNKKYHDTKIPTSPNDTINLISDLQEYRRRYFGAETADALFGAEVKMTQYNIMKQTIIDNPKLRGRQKELELKNLNQEMWGNDEGSPEAFSTPSENYDAKLAMYKKDLGEMGEAEKKQKVREIRLEYFAPDIVERLEANDKKFEDQKNSEDAYRQREKDVLADSSLSAEERDKKLEALQNEMLGDQASVFRNKEKLRKMLEGK